MNRLLIALVCLLLIGTGCTQSATKEPIPAAGKEEVKEAPKELIVVNREIASTLDPVKPLTSSYLRAVGAAEALFVVTAKGTVEPSLAASAKVLDSTTWEIKLRPNVKFWSGKNVDAAAVIASLERSRTQDPQALPFLKELAFTKQDDVTIQVKTSRSNVNVPLNLSYFQTVIHNAEAKHDSVDTADMTGMYRIKEFAPKQKLVLEANPNYWGKKPTIGKVVFEEISDEQTRTMSILSGRSHVVLNVPVTGAAQFKNHKDARLTDAPAANTQTIYLNLKKPQLQDVRVRQALSWALNREELVILGAEGQSKPVTTWLGSNPAFAEAKQAVYTKQDLDKASKLLDEAGWVKGADGVRAKDGKPLTLRLMTWGGDKALGEALQNQWTKLGVKAEVKHGDYSLIQAARDSGDWDAFIEAWSTFGDVYALLQGQFSPGASGNYGSYNDAETNALLAQLGEAADDAKRHQLALKVNERVAIQAPTIYLYPRPQLTAVSKSLQGFEQHFRQFESVVNAGLSFEKK